MPRKDISDIEINDRLEITFDQYSDAEILIDGDSINDNFMGYNFDLIRRDIGEFTLKDFTDAEIVIENADAIADAIKKAIKQIRERIKQEAETGVFVNELANVFEAVSQI